MKTKVAPRVRPILRWQGGKGRMLKHLLPKIPPHVCYVEPFAGGLAMLLAKPRSQREVINDINGELIDLYLSVQNHLPEVMRLVDMTVASREVFKLYGANHGLTEIQRALTFLYRNRISFSGDMHSFGVAKTKGGGGDFNRDKVKVLLQAVHERLNGVTIENIPYENIFRNQDSAENFFFCDPPYLDATNGAYSPWTRKDLTQFRQRLDKLKGKWLVTLDDSEFNRDLFGDCTVEAVVSENKCVNRRTHADKKFGELIITPK